MTQPISREEILERVASVSHWYHQIDLGQGVVTPGGHDSADGLACLEDIGLPIRCEGMRVLDIGARDGFFSFALERRGAEVLAIDYAAPDITGFAVCQEILGSKVQYQTCNVYDLDPQQHGLFDIVLFLGVIYHLRNPMLALDQVRSVVKPGGLMFLETQMATDRAVRRSKLPLWRFYARDSLAQDASNKWAPNMPGLVASVQEAQFKVQDTRDRKERAHVRAVAVEDQFLEHHRQLDSSAGTYGKA